MAATGALLLSLPGFAGQGEANVHTTFQVVVSGNAGSAAGGQVFLGLLGGLTASRSVSLNQPVELPAGAWSWQAEGPGFVTVGWNVVPAAQPGKAQVVTAKAVPSCEVSLTRAPRSAPPDRVQVVAPDVSTIYDVDVSTRPRWQVPAGRFFIATYRQGILTGLDSAPRSCSRGESLELTLPPRPATSDHALLLSLRLPDTTLKVTDLGLSARPSGPRRELLAQGPALVVGMGPHVLALFPQLKASQETEVRLKHPKLRSLSLDVATAGGGLTALPEQHLRRRPSLTIPVDYRPARSHRLQKIQGHFCGPRNLAATDDIVDFDGCERLAAEPTLKPGLHEYTFPDLDTGQYVFNARFDSELVYALANWCVPFLASEADGFDEIEPVPLREYHLFGHILEGEEPVPGYVRVRYDGFPAPDLLAPTGEDLIYHLYYFGHRLYPQDIEQLPRAAREAPGAKVWGLAYGVFFSACDHGGTCVAYSHGAAIAGEGRFDFQLGSNSGVEVRVIDAESRQPIEGAIVFPVSAQGNEVFRFYQGEVLMVPRLARVGQTKVGAEGTARLRMPPGRQAVGAGHEHYDPESGKVVSVLIPEDGWIEAEVELSRRAEAETDVHFLLPDGQPLGRAFLQVFDGQGARRGGCATSTRPNGQVRFAEGCLEGSTVALLHSDATITLFRGSDLARGGAFQVQPAPRRPGKVRVLADDGLPVVGATLAVAYGRIVLEPMEFNIAHGMGTGPILVGPSDSEGIIVLRGINLAPGAAPSVAVIGAKPGRPQSLAALEPGEILDVEAP